MFSYFVMQSSHISIKNNEHALKDSSDYYSPVLERWIMNGFPPTLLCVWFRGSETDVGAGAAVLAGALDDSAGVSFTPSIAMRTLDSSCSGMLPSSEEKGLGGFSKHISQLVLPEIKDKEKHNPTVL